MCFLCSQATGFETDLATIIGISETPKLDVNRVRDSLNASFSIILASLKKNIKTSFTIL